MDSQKQQASERIKQANNILVTVSNNPSVDQLAACMGLTLSLNKMGKHATAVFSGEVPSTLEFLQPEKTIEKNTDSLRDFIIALDKSKADKLRYKVEDRVVKIFITPYRTSISEKDLEFSQGDFNVDVVVALGVHNQADLDQAITSHGRILHDATIITVNVRPGGEQLGAINWLEPNASSLSELAMQLVDILDKKLVDGQIATSFLTGIVAETERFSNSKTSPQTMSVSAELMAAGANQQLVATKLEEPAAPPSQAPIATQNAAPKKTDAIPPVKKFNDGTLEIAHDESALIAPHPAPTDIEKEGEPQPPTPEKPLAEQEQKPPTPEHTESPLKLPETESNPKPELPEIIPEKPAPQIHIDEHGSLSPVGEPSEDALDESLLPPVKSIAEPTISHHNEPPKMILEPPTLGGELTANAHSDNFDEEGGSGMPGMPARESALPSSMKEDLDTPAVGQTIAPPDGGGNGEPQNAPGTSFLGDQPLLNPDAGESKANAAAPSPEETLSQIEKDVHSTHLDESPKPPIPAPEETQPQPSAFAPSSPLGGGNSLPPLSVPTNQSAPAASGSMLPPVPAMPVVTPDMPVDDGFIKDGGAAPSATAQNNEPSTNDNDVKKEDENLPNVSDARDAVAAALGGAQSNAPLDPIQSLNAQPLGTPPNSGGTSLPTPAPTNDGIEPDLVLPLAPVKPWTPPEDNQSAAQPNDQAPPPVPPPMMPQSV